MENFPNNLRGTVAQLESTELRCPQNLHIYLVFIRNIKKRFEKEKWCLVKISENFFFRKTQENFWILPISYWLYIPPGLFPVALKFLKVKKGFFEALKIFEG